MRPTFLFDRADQRTLEQFIPGRGKQLGLGTALIQGPALPIRCKQVAIARGEPILTDQIDRADIDSEFSDAVATTTRVLPDFSRSPPTTESAVTGCHGMGRHCVRSEIRKPFFQIMRDPLGQTACIDEDQRRAMLPYELATRS